MRKRVLISNSEKQTKIFAGKILKQYQDLLKTRALIFALQGELGTGKTQFVKGLALALGIKANVPSASFVLLREYPFQTKTEAGYLYHLDAWRLKKEKEIEEIGFEKMIKAGNVLAIEWSEKIRSILNKVIKSKKAQVIWVKIKHPSTTKETTKRKIIYQWKNLI